MRGFAGPWRAASMIRAHGPDTILLLPNSFRSAATARLARARRRIGYRGDGRGWLLTHAIPKPADAGRSPIPAVDWYADLVEQAFETTVSDRAPRLDPTPAQRIAASALLEGVGRPFAVLNPGANREDKRWPAERFAAVGRALGERRLEVVVNGGPAERALAREVAAACGGIDLAERGVTLGSLLGVLAEAAAVVTNDTGPRHMAIGVGAPVVALFGPTDHRWTTVAAARERLLLAEPFLPAEEIADRHPKVCRIDRITVGDVLSAVDSMRGA